MFVVHLGLEGDTKLALLFEVRQLIAKQVVFTLFERPFDHEKAVIWFSGEGCKLRILCGGYLFEQFLSRRSIKYYAARVTDYPASAQWVPILFPTCKGGRGVALTTHQHLV